MAEPDKIRKIAERLTEQMPSHFRKAETTRAERILREELEGLMVAVRDAANASAADSQMLAFQWMRRHDMIVAGVDPVTINCPKPADLPESIKRAEAAEAALRSRDEAVRQLAQLASDSKLVLELRKLGRFDSADKLEKLLEVLCK